MADNQTPDEEQTEQQDEPRSKRKLIIGAAAVMLLAAAGGVTLALSKSDGTPADADEQVAEQVEEGTGEAHYFSLDPAFVVNFQSQGARPRFLKLELDAVTYQEAKLKAIKKHMPVIRNGLVLLFSRQSYDGLLEHEDKERLRAEALTTIQDVLEQQTGGDSGVAEVFFTSFVMQ